jgi:hypothetical protein
MGQAVATHGLTGRNGAAIGIPFSCEGIFFPA